MDQQSEQTLARLIRETRVAALGTLHEGEPKLAMVAYSFAEDFSAFYIHVSKLGKHTADMESDPRVSLLITETDDRRAEPQTLARVSIRGTAEILPRTAADYTQVKNSYLERFPEAEQLFSLGDFNLWKITPKGGTLHGVWQDLVVRSILCLRFLSLHHPYDLAFAYYSFNQVIACEEPLNSKVQIH